MREREKDGKIILHLDSEEILKIRYLGEEIGWTTVEVVFPKDQSPT